MPDEITVHPEAVAANGGGHVRIVRDSVSCVSGLIRSQPHPQGIPPVMLSRGQAYYWSAAWQQGEAEALAEIAAGEALTFPDGDAAVRWLLSEDDQDAEG